MGLAFGAASDLVGAGLGVASHPGDRDGVQGAVQRSVAAAVEAVPRALAAAGLDRGDAGQGGERGFVADASVVRPADQQLRGDDWADARLGEQRRPGRVLLDQLEQLGVELGELGRQESDPCGDGLQG